MDTADSGGRRPGKDRGITQCLSSTWLCLDHASATITSELIWPVRHV
jgi:hypothetical protein